MLAALTATAALLLPAVQGHMGLWHPSGYSFDKGDTAVYPLSGKSFNEWWFHGNIDAKPKETMTLVPGKDVTLEIACSKSFTTYGSQSSADACPRDAGSYHAGGKTGSESGWAGNNEDMLRGCALAIAFKSNPHDVKPEDFTIMSVQERCVRQRDTTFSIPSNLPKCPEGGCTCSWFWAGQNSATEMYMSAFKCDVQGGSGTNYPKPSPPRKGAINGATQPYYFANDLNNLGFEPNYETKPSYNSAWGYKNGAQEIAFGGAGGNAGGNAGNAGGNTGGNAGNSGDNAGNAGGNAGGNKGGNSTTVDSGNSSEGVQSSTKSIPSSTRTRNHHRPTSTQGNGKEDWQNLAAAGNCKRRSRRHV